MSDQRVRGACVTSFAAHKHDCSGFARAVSGQVGVPLDGLADQIVDVLRHGEGWSHIEDGPAAAEAAAAGKLVVAGLKGAEQHKPDPHGHVAVIVAGELAHGKYPSAYWGSLGGLPGENKTVNFAWRTEDRDRISYAAHDLG